MYVSHHAWLLCGHKVELYTSQLHTNTDQMSVKTSKRHPLQPKQQMLFSDAHSGRPCNSTCALCDQKGTIKYTHPKTWRDPKYLDSLNAIEPLELDSCVCRPCRNDVSKALSNPD